MAAGLHPDGRPDADGGAFGGREVVVRGVTRNGAGEVVKDYGIGGLATLTRPDE